MNELLFKLAQKIDHTALKADTSSNQIEKLCREANDLSFASVCVLPTYVSYAKNLITNPNVKICTVIGFPLGATFTQTKIAESEEAIENGCQELDMVINIAELINGNYKLVREEIESLSDFCHLNKSILKVIIETCLLTTSQKIDLCKIISDSGADFIKTSTGFSTSGANIDDIILFRSNCAPEVKIKASGGIRNAQFALDLINAGANRIGTSAGIEILNEGKLIYKL